VLFGTSAVDLFYCLNTRPESSILPYKYHRSRILLPHFTLLPMKMELTEGSETSAYINQTPGNYLKGNLLYSVHGESLISRRQLKSLFVVCVRQLRW